MTISARYADADESAVLVDYGDGRTATVPAGSREFERLVDGYEDFSAVTVAAYDDSMGPDGLKAYASNRRWIKETSGITWNSISIPTDDRAKLLLLGASQIMGSTDASPLVINGVSYGDVTGTQFAAIMGAIVSHIQGTFATLATVLADIDSSTITTTSEIDTAFA